MQKKRNIRLLIIFSVLLIWTFVFISLKDNDQRIAVDDTLFTLTDTASIHQIRIIKPDNEIVLEKKGQGWLVNGKYNLDLSMRKVILAVLHEVRIKQTVPKNKLEEIRNKLLENGNKVIIRQTGNRETTYYAGGNGISVSYFMFPGDSPYIVYLPGYESYVSGIFEVSENDWRDRLIYQTSWVGLNRLSLLYPERPSDNLVIESEGDLFRIENLTSVDTTAMMDYIEMMSLMYTDQYISSGQIPKYDSLTNTIPYALLEIDALSLNKPVEIKFFVPLPGENVRLGLINDSQMCLFDQDRVRQVFKSRNDFNIN